LRDLERAVGIVPPTAQPAGHARPADDRGWITARSRWTRAIGHAPWNREAHEIAHPKMSFTSRYRGRRSPPYLRAGRSIARRAVAPHLGNLVAADAGGGKLALVAHRFGRTLRACRAGARCGAAFGRAHVGNLVAADACCRKLAFVAHGLGWALGAR